MVTWNISEARADYILKLLAQRPFAEVNALIQDLMTQANAGVQQQPPAPRQADRPADRPADNQA